MRVVLGVVVLAGCGRLGFDAVEVDVDASSTDGAPIAVCHTGVWGTPMPVSSTQSVDEESDPSLSADGLMLFFQSNRTPSLARAIWYVTRSSPTANWGDPVHVSELDDATDDLQPDISGDGLTLRFSTMRDASYVLYEAHRNDLVTPFSSDGVFTIDGDAITPRYASDLSADGLRLYYGRDLEVAFASRATLSAAFTFARELDEVNVPATDGNPSISADGLELFFDTYRNGPAQIFRATRPTLEDMFGTAEALDELLPAGATEYGTPEISQDGRTLYYSVNNSAQIDLYTSTRTCD